MQGLLKQLLYDLKQSWQKSVLLGLLLLVGMYFWIPPLYRSVFVNSAAATPVVAAPVTGTATSPSPIPTFTTPTGIDSAGDSSSIDWENIAKVLRNDLLLQSAETAVGARNPFGIDHEQFPLVGLFTPDPEPSDEPAETVADSDADRLPSSLVLRSTIVGSRRKAAFINRKLYIEGSAFAVDGRTFLLAAVHPRHVILTSGKKTYELGLPEKTDEKKSTADTPPQKSG
jgi:hypothetical protein